MFRNASSFVLKSNLKHLGSVNRHFSNGFALTREEMQELLIKRGIECESLSNEELENLLSSSSSFPRDNVVEEDIVAQLVDEAAIDRQEFEVGPLRTFKDNRGQTITANNNSIRISGNFGSVIATANVGCNFSFPF